MAAAVDDLSQGRLVLGLGAGWQEREHTNYGWDLLDLEGALPALPKAWKSSLACCTAIPLSITQELITS